MKKAGIILAILAVVIVIVIVFFTGNSRAEILSDEEVREIVTGQYPGDITELSFDSQTAAYKVKVETDKQTYEVLVDGESGEVQSIEQTASKTKEEKRGDKEQEPPAKEKQTAEAESPENEQEEKSGEVEKTNAMLSQEEIKEIALGEFQGTITELELDEDDGRMLYEVEIEKNDDEATIEIDAYTGQVIMVEIDRDD